MKTARPAPIPAFAPMPRPELIGAGSCVLEAVLVGVDDDRRLEGLSLLAEVLVVDAGAELKLAVTTEVMDADADALVDTTTSFPTVAASVNNLELVLQ